MGRAAMQWKNTDSATFRGARARKFLIVNPRLAAGLRRKTALPRARARCLYRTVFTALPLPNASYVSRACETLRVSIQEVHLPAKPGSPKHS